MRLSGSMVRWMGLASTTALCFSPLVAMADDPGPAVGETFPHQLAAPDQHGAERSLDNLMGERGLVLLFVRSADWCPICRRQLVEVNERLGEFEALGFGIVTVSVDDVDTIAGFAEQQGIAYTMLADPNGDINEALGIRDPQYPVGSAAFGVPRPVLYVLDRRSTVRAVHMEPTFRTRPDLDAVLAGLEAPEFQGPGF
jgi:peroxiredoxin